MMFLCALISSLLLITNCVEALQNAVKGKRCAQNQVVNKLTVYEDGAIEAECGPLPCGTTSYDICSDDSSSCKAPTEVFSGMKWAHNGQSLLLRCCPLQVKDKVYIGTDLVTLGSYYTGGIVPEQDRMGQGQGTEYDFVANARTEQGGVRVWVYRAVCGATGHQKSAQPQQQVAKQQQQPAQQPQPAAVETGESTDEKPEHVQQVKAPEESEQVQNPLQYRPRNHRQMRRDVVPPNAAA